MSLNSKNSCDNQASPSQVCLCHTPFVILFGERSGSTFFSSKLNSHPDIASRQEDFYATRVGNETEPRGAQDWIPFARGWFQRQLSISDDQKVTKPNADQTVEHMRRIFDVPVRASGFKFKYPIQHHCFPEIVNELEHMRSRLRVIWMRRRNVLKQAVSRQNLERIHAVSKKTVSHVYEDRKLAPLRLDVHRAIVYARILAKHSAALEKLVEPFEHVLEICYEDLLSNSDAVMSKSLNFLNVSTEVELSSNVFKATHDDLRIAINNYGELESRIRGTELEPFLN